MAIELSDIPHNVPGRDYSFQNQSDVKVDNVVVAFRDDSFPPLPTSQLVCAIALFISGIALIILGFVSEVVSIDPSRGIAFWVLGSVTFIPGSYFSYKFYKAYRAQTPLQRMRILREIPDFN
jgi:hypothetical protein